MLCSLQPHGEAIKVQLCCLWFALVQRVIPHPWYQVNPQHSFCLLVLLLSSYQLFIMSKTLMTAVLAGLAAFALFYYEVPLGLLHTSKQLQIDTDLRPHLSSNANIHLPNSQGFDVATDRWNPWMNPTFDIVVEVATEEDVGETIKFANRQGSSFLAVSGGHGATKRLGGVKNAVGIWMRQLADVEVLEGGKSAKVGGGIKSKELVDALWKEGKQTGMEYRRESIVCDTNET
jgi:hypothetical protein